MLAKLNSEEKEFLAKELMNNIFGIFSPFELDENVDFPKKDELGGVVLKFIGGGAAYLKTQTVMPTEHEVESIHEVGRFLKSSFGEYVVISVLCTPDIEIYDINVDDFVDMHVDFSSARRTNGDFILHTLTEKISSNIEFDEEDHYFALVLPFFGHDDEDFDENYAHFFELYRKSSMELPSECKLNTYNVWSRLFTR